MSRLIFVLSLVAAGCRAGGNVAVQRTSTEPATRIASVDQPTTINERHVVPAQFEEPPLPAVGTTVAPETAHESPAESAPSDGGIPAGAPLTLAALEQVALGWNPTIPQAQALVHQQEGLTVQAGLYPNPQAGYVRSDADQNGTSQTSGLFLSQEFVTAGKLRLAQAASQHDVSLRSWQLNAQQQRVLNDLRIRYYELLGAQQAVLAARELEQSAADGVRIAQELIEARQRGRPDLLQAEMQLSTAQGTLRDAEYRLQAARRQLASVAGVPQLPEGELVGSLDDGIPELDWDARLQQLLEESPLLKSQAAELQAAETEVQLARAQAVPNVSLQVVAQRDTIQKSNSVSTLIALPVPLFNRNQGGIINAEGVLWQQQKEYERLRLALTDQLAGSYRQYCSLRSEARRVQSELLPRAKENLELTAEAYRQGRLDFLRVVDARKTYFAAKMSHIDTLTELHKVVTEIEGWQLTGGLNPTEVGTALQTTPGLSGSGSRGVLMQQLEGQRNNINRNLPGAIQAGER